MNKISEAIKNVIPDTWTHEDNINFLALRFQLKLAGINWKSEEHLASLLSDYTKKGIIEVKQEGGIAYMRARQ